MAAPPPLPDPDDPLAPARGLGIDGLLERLGGAEEAAVVRGALECGISPAVVVEELQHEVERRLLRSARFYDEAQW